MAIASKLNALTIKSDDKFLVNHLRKNDDVIKSMICFERIKPNCVLCFEGIRIIAARGVSTANPLGQILIGLYCNNLPGRAGPIREDR